MSNQTVTLDVREEIRAGREPFTRIMQAVAQLGEGQALRLIAPFEPTPLFAVLGRRGFTHQATPLGNGDWEVCFSQPRPAGAHPETAADPENPAEQGEEFVELDARGLEPPQPLVTILEALGGLPDGATLRAHTDRRPMHLYAQLADRGFTGESEEQSDGSFITDIRRQ
jgi:uncharacterized protein (DUF2249 family)